MSANMSSTPKFSLATNRFIYLLVAYAALTIGFCLYLYWQTSIWQALLPPLITLGSALAMPLAFRLRSAGRLRTSAALISLAIAAAYGANELVWRGLTVYHMIGGTLFIILAGMIFAPAQIPIWGVSAAGYIASLALVNRFEPLDRYEQYLIPTLLPYTIGVMLLFLLALVVQIYVQRPARSIRVRLIGTFVLLVIVPLVLTTTIASMINVQTVQNQLFDQLTSVVDMKEKNINAWLDRLLAELKVASPTEYEIQWLFDGSAQNEAALNSAAAQVLLERFRRVLQETGLFDEIFLIDPAGEVILSTTKENLGLYLGQQDIYQQGRLAEFISPPTTSVDGRLQMTVVAPLASSAGMESPLLIAGRVNMEKLDELLAVPGGLGASGETYLVGRSHRLLTSSVYPGFQAGQSFVFSSGIYQALENRSSGKGVYAGYQGDNVLGVYRWLPRMEAALMAEQSQSEVYRSIFRSIYVNLFLMALAALTALLIGLVATNRITAPLRRLSQTAERIAAGELHLTAEVEELDEIGALARSFNDMTAQLRGIVSNLEARIQERTEALETRSRQLQIAVEVARELTALRDVNELLNGTVDLIHDRFDYYYVGIYLLDDIGGEAVLAAATGEAGQILLERSHRVHIGDPDIVSDVALAGRIRAINDIVQDPYYQVSPLLPDTRAVAAIPLKVGADVGAVIEVHSLQRGAFSDEALYMLQIVTDQLSIALQNVRLLHDMQQTVKELESVYGSFTQKAWQSIERRSLAARGYRYQNMVVGAAEGEHPLIDQAIQLGKMVIAAGDVPEPSAEAGAVLAVPVKMRGQTIGAFELRFDQAEIPEPFISMYEELADRLALILENARLLQEAQHLAMREQQINLISTKIRNTISLEAVLQNTVQELGRAFGSAHTFIQLKLDDLPATDRLQGGQHDS